MASSASAVANSSKQKQQEKQKTKQSAIEPIPLSKEMIESESELDDENAEEDEDDDSSSEDEADSEEDLEGITPRKNKTNGATVEVSASQSKAGKRLPKYAPPNGMSELKMSTAFTQSPFEWNALASKTGVEVWAIRAPRDLKPARLSSLIVSAPKKGSTITGTLKTKSQSYTLSAAGSSKHTHVVVDAEGRQPTAGPGLVDAMAMDVDGQTSADLRVEGGEEMEGGMRLLVPRAQKDGRNDGKLYVAPVQITRHLLLTPEATSTAEPEPASDTRPLPSFLSTSTPANTETPSSVHPDSALPSKRPQPTHLMKFRNHAYGFSTPGPASAGQTTTSIASSQATVKEKKRKSEAKADSPSKKKTKKAKV